MKFKSIFRSTGAIAVGALILTVSSPALAIRIYPHVAGVPQSAAANRASSWLASQFTASGDVMPYGSPDASDTALSVLAFSATATQRATALKAVKYLQAHIHDFVSVGGHDGPGQLATLILVAKSMKLNPRSFSGRDLVARLLATQRVSGPDKGLFGVQDPTYDGAYREGLSLSALAAVGVMTGSQIVSAKSWLKQQQCTSGGWEAYRSTSVACTAPDPNTYTGADTNSTALAIEGLAAQHTTSTYNAVTFLTSIQASDAGWGYYGGSSDPDSTALVIQALISLHQSLTSSKFVKSGHSPVDALLGFQLSSGAMYYPSPPSPNSPSNLATEQAVPALMGKKFPY